MGTACVDESMRTLDGVSTCLLWATVFQSEECQLGRLVSLKAKGAKKLHWRELGRTAQVMVMDASQAWQRRRRC